jgi:chitosanase
MFFRKEALFLSTLLIGLLTVTSVFAAPARPLPTFENPYALSTTDRSHIDQVVSIFENGSTQLKYEYIEDIHDGRGYTAGRMGATTSTTDFLFIVLEYLRAVPHSAFTKILPKLQAASGSESGEIKGLESLPAIWKDAATNPKTAAAFRQAQDNVADWMYFDPAVRLAKEAHIESKLGILCFYDTFIQQGKDGLEEVIRDTQNRGHYSERSFLLHFLSFRKYALLHPSDKATRKAWRESIGRVYALRKLVRQGNFNLKGPFQINPFHDPKPFTVQ